MSSHDTERLMTSVRMAPVCRPSKLFYIEPVLILYFLTQFPMDLLSQRYVLDWVKKELIASDLQHNITHGNTTISPCQANISKEDYGFEEKVQSFSSTFAVVRSITWGIPALVVTALLGACSDKYGRRLAVTPPLMGILLSATILTLVLSLNQSIYLLLIGDVLYGLGGSYASLTMGGFSYVADRTRPEKRMIRITLLEMCMLTPGIVSPIALGALLERLGFVNTMYIISAISVVNLAYTLCCMRDDIKNRIEVDDTDKQRVNTNAESNYSSQADSCSNDVADREKQKANCDTEGHCSSQAEISSGEFGGVDNQRKATDIEDSCSSSPTELCCKEIDNTHRHKANTDDEGYYSSKAETRNNENMDEIYHQSSSQIPTSPPVHPFTTPPPHNVQDDIEVLLQQPQTSAVSEVLRMAWQQMKSCVELFTKIESSAHNQNSCTSWSSDVMTSRSNESTVSETTDTIASRSTDTTVSRSSDVSSANLNDATSPPLCSESDAEYQPSSRRLKLNLLLLAFFLSVLPTFDFSIDPLFQMNSPLCWDISMIGLYSGLTMGVATIGGMICAPVLKLRLHDSSIALIASAALISSSAYKAFVTNTLMMMLASSVSMLSVLLIPSIRSLMSSLVSEQEQGTVFGVIGCVELICGIVGTLIFNSLYSATLQIFTGLVFLVMSTFYVLSATVLLTYKLLIFRECRRLNYSLIVNE